MHSATVRLRICILATMLVGTLAPTATSKGISFYASFADNETIGATTYSRRDVLHVENSDVSIFHTTGDFFTMATRDNANLDALFVDPSGDIYFSITGSATILGGIAGGAGGIHSGDVIRYSPNATGNKFSYFLEDAGPDIDALWIDANGVPYLSFSESSAVVGSNQITVLDDMVFKLTGDRSLTTGTVSVVLDSNILLLGPGVEPKTSTDIDAFSVTSDGKYLFSTTGTNRIYNDDGTAYVDRDSGVVYLFDPAAPAAFQGSEASAIYFDATATFGTSVNIDAIHFLPDGSPPEANADLNGDGIVNLADYTVWRDNLGGSGPVGDANGADGVTATDYSVWKQQFGTNVSPLASLSGSGSPVPEPPALWAFCCVAATILMGRRTRGERITC